MVKILLMGEDPSAREFIAEDLAGEGHLVATIGNPALIGELLITFDPDLVLLHFHRWQTFCSYTGQRRHDAILERGQPHGSHTHISH